MPPIHRIVLTGGPCAGKSTALLEISERLVAGRFAVYRVPEASTLLLSGGARVVGASLEQLLAFQEAILRVTLTQEEAFLRIAASRDEPAVLLFDRGVMDGSAYLPEECWARVLRRLQLEAKSLIDGRYDAIIHLVTAAEGAEEHYQTVNNTIRYETVPQAREVCRRLRQAWLAHPRVEVIDNSTGFEAKMQRAVAAVCRVVGLEI